jgi:polysaccharide biosynthesis protein PslH
MVRVNVLLVTPVLPQRQPTNAGALVAWALLSGLRNRHQVTLATVVGPDFSELEALHTLTACGIDVQAIRWPEPRGLARWRRRWRLASTWLRGVWPWRTVWYWQPALQVLLNRLGAERHFDLVLLEDSSTGIYRVPDGIPTIFTEYEVRRPQAVTWRPPPGRSSILWPISQADGRRWRRYQTSIWGRFDRIQVFTPSDARLVEDIAPALGGRVRINPFGIELPEPTDSGQDVRGSLVFTGGFSHLPNVDAAVWLGTEIMPRVRTLCPDARLTLVGSEPPPVVRRLSGADVTVTGRVPAVEPFLKRAAVVVAPVRLGGGMRMKVLQGMAHGKAVVTTSRGAEGFELTPDPRPFMVADDAEGFAHAVAALLRSDSWRHELGVRARASVAEHFSPDAYVRRLEATWAELLPPASRT